MEDKEQEYDIFNEAGFKSICFAFQTGGGEDEDDVMIYVKDNIAVKSIGFYKYVQCDYSKMNYITGWDWDNEKTFDLNNLKNK